MIAVQGSDGIWGPHHLSQISCRHSPLCEEILPLEGLCHHQTNAPLAQPIRPKSSGTVRWHRAYVQRSGQWDGMADEVRNGVIIL